MSHIFISYAKVDTRDLAEGLFQALNELEGFSAWLDESLEPASSWALQIQKEIDKADIVLVLLSPDVNRAESLNQRRSFVLNEIDYAQQAHKRILPIMAQKTNMPVQIAGVQYIDFTQDPNKGYERLVRTLERLNASQKVTVSSAIDEAKTPAPFPSPKQTKKQTGMWVWTSIIGILLIVGIGGSILLSNLGNNITKTPEVTMEVAVSPSPTANPVDVRVIELRAATQTLEAQTAIAQSETENAYITETQIAQILETSTAVEIQALATLITWTPIFTNTSSRALTADAAATNIGITATANAIATRTQVTNNTATHIARNTQNVQATMTQVSLAATLNHPEYRLNEAIRLASTPMVSNNQWEALYPDGFVWLFDNVPMVLVPAGCFEMGSDANARFFFLDGGTSHWIIGVPDGGTQCFDEPFWIDQMEVSQGQFEALGGTKEQENRYEETYLHPITRIAWDEAHSYCQIQRGGRLPTEAEWEYVARGVNGSVYPWGNSWNVELVNWGDYSNSLVNVESFFEGASWVNALHLIGNASEMTRSIYRAYPYDSEDGRENERPNADNFYSVRGGSFINGGSVIARSATREVGYYNEWHDGLGFRCMRPID